MNRPLHLVLSFLLLTVTGVLTAQSKIVIDGQLTGVEEGTSITLLKAEGNVSSSVAEDTLRQGKFHLEYAATDQGVERYSIMSFDEGFPSMSLQLWAMPGHNIFISGDNKLVYTWKVKSDIDAQNDWSYFVDQNKKDWDAFQKLSVQRKRLIQIRISGEGGDAAQKKAKASIRRIDSLTDQLQTNIYRHNLKLLENKKISEVGLEVLGSAAMLVKWNGVEELRTPITRIYNRLSAAQKNSPTGLGIHLALFPPEVVKVGEPMYDTLLKDLKGNTHHLADLKGKYILLDFWSMGCGPCHAAFPEMKDIAEKLKDSLAIVSITSDNQKVWKKASGIFELTWNNWSDNKENRGIYAQYGVSGIPHYVLIDPSGVLKAVWTGYGEGSLKKSIKKYTQLAVD